MPGFCASNLNVAMERDNEIWKLCDAFFILLPTGSEEREVLGVGSIPVAILPS